MACLCSRQVEEFVFRDPELAPDKEAVIVKVDFEPIVLETMLKFKDQKKVWMMVGEGWDLSYQMLSFKIKNKIKLN